MQRADSGALRADGKYEFESLYVNRSLAASRHVVLGAKIGLFVLDLENPYALPQFFAHRTTWEVADIQWNPHHAHREWVASTSNQKLVLWNLSRPEAAKAPLPADVVVDTASKRRIRETSSKSAVRSRALAHTQRSVQPVESASSAIESLFDAHTRAITDINWSPIHPEILASCSVDTWTYIWDLRMNGRGSGKPAQGYSAWNASMTQVKWNRVSSHRIAASCDNKVLIWDDRFGALPLASVEAHQSKIYGLQWSPDSDRGRDQFMTCSLDGTIKYWDIGTETSRAASGHRRLITEPEASTATLRPVWRAKYLPFGQGAMSVAQRGDNAPSLWASGSQMQPVKRFEGHTDIVREFLFRKKGGSDPCYDDREFQLLTWSKDQTLRMWPISDEIMKAVGHTPGAPIQGSSEPHIQASNTQCGIKIQEPRREVSEAWNSSPTNTSYGSSANSSRYAASDVSRSPIDRTGFYGGNPSSLPSRSPASMRPRHTPPSRSPATLFRRRSTLDRGPQMRYQDQDELPEAFHDPVNWITRVQIERGDEAGDEAAPSAHLPKTKPDYGILADEIMRVGRRFPQVFEAIDVTHRRCTALISGPWGEQEQALAYLRVTFTFPTQYPQRPPAVEVERNPSIPIKTKAELQSVLVDVVEEQSARQAPCLEACIEALVTQSSASSSQEPEPEAAPEESVSPSAHNYGGEPGQFLQSYQDVADAVVRLTLRASDAQESELLESDVVQLMSANVLSRAKRPRFPPENITDNAT